MYFNKFNPAANQHSKKRTAGTAGVKVALIQILMTRVPISLRAFHIFPILRGQ